MSQPPAHVLAGTGFRFATLPYRKLINVQWTMCNVQNGEPDFIKLTDTNPVSPSILNWKNYLFLTEDGFGASIHGIRPRPNGSSVSQEFKTSEIPALILNNQQNKLQIKITTIWFSTAIKITQNPWQTTVFVVSLKTEINNLKNEKEQTWISTAMPSGKSRQPFCRARPKRWQAWIKNSWHYTME